MTASKLDAPFLRDIGCDVVRIKFDDENAYVEHVKLKRPDLIPQQLTEGEVRSMFQDIMTVPLEVFACEAVFGLSDEERRQKLRSLVDPGLL